MNIKNCYFCNSLLSGNFRELRCLNDNCSRIFNIYLDKNEGIERIFINAYGSNIKEKYYPIIISKTTLQFNVDKMMISIDNNCLFDNLDVLFEDILIKIEEYCLFA